MAAPPVAGPYLKVYRNTVSCSPHDFAELWALKASAPASETQLIVGQSSFATLPSSAIPCFAILDKIKQDLHSRVGQSVTASYTAYVLTFSPNGSSPLPQLPKRSGAAYCYMFNAPLSPPVSLQVAEETSENVLWETRLNTGDLLVIGGPSDHLGPYGLKMQIAAAHNRGQRISVTACCLPEVERAATVRRHF